MLGQGSGLKAIEIVKSFLASREILLEELQKISDAVGQTVDELCDADLTLGKYETIVASRAGVPLYSIGSSGTNKGVGQLAGILHNFLEVYYLLAVPLLFLFFFCVCLKFWHMYSCKI